MVGWKVRRRRLAAVFGDGGAIGGFGLRNRRGADVLIAKQAVFEAVDPAVYGQFLSAVPCVADDGGLAHVGNLFDDVELTQPIHALIFVG